MSEEESISCQKENPKDTQASKKASDVNTIEDTTNNEKQNPATIELHEEAPDHVSNKDVPGPDSDEEVPESTSDETAAGPDSDEEVPESTSNETAADPKTDVPESTSDTTNSSKEVPESTSSVKAAAPICSDKPTQRRPRLNRRSLQMINEALDSPPEKNTPEPNAGSSKSVNRPGNKSLIKPVESRIISLSSIKNSTCQKAINPRGSSRIIVLRQRASSTSEKEKTVTTEVGSAEPPKKKHKPITWP